MPQASLIQETPTADEYIALRDATGLSSKTPEAVRLGLLGSLFAVCIRDGEKLIGMGRVVGDGGCFFQIVDVAVHPDYQRRGLGYQIMERLMGYLRDYAPESAYVSLMADHGAAALYQKFGFEFTAPNSVGMATRL